MPIYFQSACCVLVKTRSFSPLFWSKESHTLHLHDCNAMHGLSELNFLNIALFRNDLFMALWLDICEFATDMMMLGSLGLIFWRVRMICYFGITSSSSHAYFVVIWNMWISYTLDFGWILLWFETQVDMYHWSNRSITYLFLA